MNIKDKKRVFKCIPLYSMYCFPGNPIKFTSIRKRISYKKNNLTQCMNIINGGITKCMITYDQIPGFFKGNQFCTKAF